MDKIETLEQAKARIIQENKDKKVALSIKLKRPPVKDDSYMSFIEELKAIIVEGEFASRWQLIETYHEVGKFITDYETESRRDIPMERVAEDAHLSVQTLKRAVHFYKKYPDINKLPQGKAISWHTIVNKLLPEPGTKPWANKDNKPEGTDWIICPFCDGRFNALKARRSKENEI